jgi:hypothetical protein
VNSRKSLRESADPKDQGSAPAGGKPQGCRSLLPLGWQASSHLEDWPLPLGANGAGSGSLTPALRDRGFACQSFASRIAPSHVWSATCRMTNYRVSSFQLTGSARLLLAHPGLRLYLTLAVDFGCKTVPGVSGVRRRRPICAEAGRELLAAAKDKVLATKTATTARVPTPGIPIPPPARMSFCRPNDRDHRRG